MRGAPVRRNARERCGLVDRVDIGLCERRVFWEGPGAVRGYGCGAECGDVGECAHGLREIGERGIG